MIKPNLLQLARQGFPEEKIPMKKVSSPFSLADFAYLYCVRGAG